MRVVDTDTAGGYCVFGNISFPLLAYISSHARISQICVRVVAGVADAASFDVVSLISASIKKGKLNRVMITKVELGKFGGQSDAPASPAATSDIYSKLSAWRAQKVAEWATSDTNSAIRRSHQTRSSLNAWMDEQCGHAMDISAKLSPS